MATFLFVLFILVINCGISVAENVSGRCRSCLSKGGEDPIVQDISDCSMECYYTKRTHDHLQRFEYLTCSPAISLVTPSHSDRNEEEKFYWNTCDIDVCPHRYLRNANNSEKCTCPGIGQTVESHLVYKCDSTPATSVSPDVQINDVVKTFTLLYKVNDTFNDELADKNSNAYKRLSSSVLNALSDFCQCEPKNVSFSRGSIGVRVTLEYDLDYSSGMVFKILSKAQVQGDLLRGKDTYDVELILPNGETRSVNHFSVGNICNSLDDEIRLKPNNSRSTIEIPLQMSAMHESNADTCSCIFDVAENKDAIKLRTRYEVNGMQMVNSDNDDLEIETCNEHNGCDDIDLKRREQLHNDVSHLNVKLTKSETDLNATMYVNVLFYETTLYMSCGTGDLTRSKIGQSSSEEDSTEATEQPTSLSSLDSVNLRVVLPIVAVSLTIAATIMCVISYKKRNNSKKQNPSPTAAPTTKPIDDRKTICSGGYECIEEEYDFLPDKDLISNNQRSIRPPNKQDNRSLSNKPTRRLEDNTRRSLTNWYSDIEEGRIDRFSKLASVNEIQSIKEGKGHMVTANPNENAETLKSGLPDDFSLAGHCVTPNTTTKQLNERSTDAMDRSFDLKISQTNSPENTSVNNLDAHSSIQKDDSGMKGARRDDNRTEVEVTSDTNSEILEMEDNVAYAGYSDEAK